MKWIPLAELVRPAGCRAGTDVGLPVYSVTKHEGFVPSSEYFKKQVFSKDLSDYKRLDRGQFAYATIHLDEGSIGIAPEACLISPMYTVFEVDVNRVEPRYLLRFMKSSGALAQYSRFGKGTVHRRKSISLHALRGLEVPLPELDEQRRIAAVLDQADALRAKRRQTLDHLKELRQSIFLEMFGDPAANPFGWEFAPLKDVSTVAGEYGASVPSIEYDPRLPRYVRITDVAESGELTPDQRSPGGDFVEWQRYELTEGDLLFARSGATVGKTYLHTESNGACVFAGYFIRFRIDQNLILPRFLFAFTKTYAYETWVRVHKNVVAQPNINAKQYGSELLVPVPPIALQHEFVRMVGSIARVSSLMRQAQRNESALYPALQARLFSTGAA